MEKSESEIGKEIENILTYIETSSGKATGEWRSFLEEALRYYDALFDWQNEFYFGSEEFKRMKTAELLQECVIDMEASLFQVVTGLWKPAFVSLRSCLETGVLLVSFSLPHPPASYDDFFEGKLNTPPFTRKLIRAIFDVEPFQAYNHTYNLDKRIRQIYSSLCDYVHTKGWKQYEGHLREIVWGGDSFLEIPPLAGEEVWEKWLLQVQSVYQGLSLLFTLATPTFCQFLKNVQLPRSEKLRTILAMMDDQDVEQMNEFVKTRYFT